jgi:hypothetical protein
VEAVRLLLDLGLDPNAQALTGRVALHGAGHKGATEVVKLLVARGAKMDVRDWGNTDNRGSPELAAHTWLPVDYADGLSVSVQSACIGDRQVLRDLMKQQDSIRLQRTTLTRLHRRNLQHQLQPKVTSSPWLRLIGAARAIPLVPASIRTINGAVAQ